jgi:3-dehydroquinate synthase
MRNIVLTGFMGTGKTAVGRVVARILGREFIDMDTLIADCAENTIPRIFAEDGEAVFRRMEKELCRELSGREDLVIATGGGALVDPENHTLMMKTGTVVCLTASRDEIVRRLNEMDLSARPLLGDNPQAAVARLMEARRDAYRAFPWRIDTTGLPVEEVAQRVIEIATEITLTVRHPGGSYEIRIGDGLLNHLGDLMQEKVHAGGRIAVVTNAIVAPLYAAAVEEELRGTGFTPFICDIPDGEAHKTLKTVEHLYENFLNGGLDRGGVVVSLGGGVTGDIAGFAAATFMRGVGFVQIPTTLLAMIDASVGGKTGVDLPRGKNLVGAFKQPSLVLIDPSVLSSLPVEELKNGIAETIKHGIIGSPTLFGELESNPELAPIPAARIARALRVKIEIVEQDPYEQGVRAVLNLGHTIGHALERLSGFVLSHGKAVAIGLVAAAQIAVRLGRADPELVDRVESILSAWNLPIRVSPYPAGQVIAAMAHDKKRMNGRLRFILPRRIGEVEIVDDVPPEVIRIVLCEMKARC